MSKLLATTLVLLIVLGLDFLLFAGLVYLICFCFSIAFTWKLALGIWLVVEVLKLCFKSTSN